MAADDYRIEKRRVQVLLHDSEGEVWEGAFLCDPYSSRHSGPQLLSELLNDPQPFVPLFEEGKEAATLVHKRHILYVEMIPGGGGVGLEQVADFGDLKPVVLVLPHEHEVQGKVSVSGPEGQTRVLDYLNRSERFVQVLRSEGDCVVNLDFVIAANDAPVRE